MKIREPLIELLAIKLYEHDCKENVFTASLANRWMDLSEDDRESYRELARGQEDLP